MSKPEGVQHWRLGESIVRKIKPSLAALATLGGATKPRLCFFDMPQE